MDHIRQVLTAFTRAASFSERFPSCEIDSCSPPFSFPVRFIHSFCGTDDVSTYQLNSVSDRSAFLTHLPFLHNFEFPLFYRPFLPLPLLQFRHPFDIVLLILLRIDTWVSPGRLSRVRGSGNSVRRLRKGNCARLTLSVPFLETK